MLNLELGCLYDLEREVADDLNGDASKFLNEKVDRQRLLD